MCSCLPGYYETGNDELNCGKCSYKCATCSGSADNCTSCATGLGRTSAIKPNCDCLPGYFDDGNDNADCI